MRDSDKPKQQSLLRHKRPARATSSTACTTDFSNYGFIGGAVRGGKSTANVRLLGTVLGRGSFGSVILGQDALDSDLVAVKSIGLSQLKASERAMQRVRSEIDCLVQIKGSSERALQLRYVIENDCFIYIVTNFIPGMTLEQALVRYGRMTEANAALHLKQLCETVKAVHARQWVHHDISLTNVVMSPGDGLHLIDFGLAQHSASPDTLLNSFGATPFFSAPELLAQQPHRGAPVDAYALGVILFAMLNNRLPYPANNIVELRAMASEPATLVFDADVGEAARAVVLGLLRPNPAQRLSIDDVLQCDWLRSLTANAAAPTVATTATAPTTSATNAATTSTATAAAATTTTTTNATATATATSAVDEIDDAIVNNDDAMMSP